MIYLHSKNIYTQGLLFLEVDWLVLCVNGSEEIKAIPLDPIVYFEIHTLIDQDQYREYTESINDSLCRR